MKKLLIVPFLLLSIVQAKTFQCQVTEVIDGQTIACLTDQRKSVKVRLYQIEAPRRYQYGAEEAHNALLDMVYNQRVTVKVKNRYKQMITGVILADPYKCPEQNCDPEHPDCIEKTCYKDMNLLMVEQGYAWYRPASQEDLTYRQAEAKSREAKRGIWATPSANKQPKPYHYFDVD